MTRSQAKQLLYHEARSIRARLLSLEVYSEQMPMVATAAVRRTALGQIEGGLEARRRRLRSALDGYVAWLRAADEAATSPAQAQRKLARLRLLFGALLSEYDLFADALTQRSEHYVGRLLGGLDEAAEDMLGNARGLIAGPTMVTYLDRGPGAAIRRANTRLPGGGRNPVALVRVPRERMVSTGLAGSLAHEVGHQAASLLGLVQAVKKAVEQTSAREVGATRNAWLHFGHWASEIIADYWAVGRIGVTHGVGLMALFNLPTPHVFAGGLNRVHPIPWIRVPLSLAIGASLRPDPQWARLQKSWKLLYPLERAPATQKPLLEALQTTLPQFVERLLELRPPRLRGLSLRELMADERLFPAKLKAEYATWHGAPQRMTATSPRLVFAVMGQARADGDLRPEEETYALEQLILRWATARFQRDGQPGTSPRHNAALGITTQPLRLH